MISNSDYNNTRESRELPEDEDMRHGFDCDCDGCATAAPAPQAGLNPELTLQHAMDYVASRYGATFAHHILAKAKA
jgi:hypothetical protein